MTNAIPSTAERTSARSAPIDAERLLSVLATQRDLYRQLHHLSEQQRRIISLEDPDHLLTVLAARQKIIDRLQGISDVLAPLRENWETIARALPADRTAQVDAVLGEIRDLLAGIMECDESDGQRLSARMVDTGRQLQSTDRQRQANTVYTGGLGGATTTLLDARS